MEMDGNSSVESQWKRVRSRRPQNCWESNLFSRCSLPDPHQLFNAELEGTARRAIKLVEGDTIKECAFMNLLQSGAEFNASKAVEKKKNNAGPEQTMLD